MQGEFFLYELTSCDLFLHHFHIVCAAKMLPLRSETEASYDGAGKNSAQIVTNGVCVINVSKLTMQIYTCRHCH